MIEDHSNADVDVGATAVAGAALSDQVKLTSHYKMEAFDPDGNLKWVEEFDNVVTNEGLDDVIDQYFKGTTYTAAHYVGLTDGTPTVAGTDTMATHAGWVEVTAYSEGTRPALSLGATSSQSASNSASKASFSIDTNSTTIGGGFLSTNSSKGGSAGVLYSVAAFTAGNKQLDNGDTLNVTVTVSMSSA